MQKQISSYLFCFGSVHISCHTVTFILLRKRRWCWLYTQKKEGHCPTCFSDVPVLLSDDYLEQVLTATEKLQWHEVVRIEARQQTSRPGTVNPLQMSVYYHRLICLRHLLSIWSINKEFGTRYQIWNMCISAAILFKKWIATNLVATWWPEMTFVSSKGKSTFLFLLFIDEVHQW